MQKEGFGVKGSGVTQALRLREELCGRWEVAAARDRVQVVRGFVLVLSLGQGLMLPRHWGVSVTGCKQGDDMLTLACSR